MNLTRPNNLQNAAAIKMMAIIDRKDILTLTVIQNQVITVVTKPFTDWTHLYFTDQTIGFRETVSETVNGRVYGFQVSGLHPGDTPELRYTLSNLEARQFVVAVQDAHDMVRLIGNKQFGLPASYDSVIEPEMGGKRGTIINLSGELAFPSAIWAI